MWIGTEKGLCKYSGSTIHCYRNVIDDKNSIDGNNISFLMLDSDHLIWTAIYNKGINVFDINGKKIYDFAYEPETDQSLLHDNVWGMWEDQDGYIWISYFYGGITRYDKKNGKYDHFSIDDEKSLKNHRPRTVVSISKHRKEDHTYWLATSAGLVKFNTRTREFSSFIFSKPIEQKTHESQYNKNKLVPRWARNMCQDNHGNLWIGSYGGLVKFNIEEETYEIFRQVEDQTLNNVCGVINYDNDHIMLSFVGGLSLINIHTHELTVLASIKGNNPNNLTYGRMYRSKNGCIYILNRNGEKEGIYKYCDASDMTIDYRTGHYHIDLAVTDNYIHYHRFRGGIESKNLQTGEIIVHEFEIKDGSTIRSMDKLGGDKIIVSDIYHMYEYHPEKGLKKIEELSQSDVYRHESVFIDSDGDIWNGRQRNGLFILDKETGEVTHLNHESTPPLVYQDYVVDILEDYEGDIWIATEQGWSIFNKKNQSTKNYLSKDVTHEHSSEIRTINTLAQSSKGSVWLGSSANGIFLWNKSEERITKHFNVQKGLNTNGIYDIKVDANQNLWIATDKGISWVNTTTDEIKNFGKEVGISGATYVLEIKNDQLYAGHITGYFQLSIEQLLKFNQPIPKPVMTGFRLYDKRQDSLLLGKEEIRLKHNENFFSFTYGSINYFDPHREKYQYRLKGIDQDWINDRGDLKKEYTNIDHGTYDFQVRMKTSSKLWTNPVSIKIIIEPAWYESLLAKIIAILAGSLLIWFLVRSYISKQKKELEIDKRFAQLETMILKSQMNPHFIFNSLNSIRYIFMKDEKDKGLKYITKFARLLRTTLHHGEHALVNLEDEIDLTELFIQLEQLRFEDSFTFNSDYGDNAYWKEIKIPPFVIQPIVENAFWHGLLPSKKENKQLNISIQKTKNEYQIIIEDNGVGIATTSKNSLDPALNKNKSYGLNIIRERFALMNKNEALHYDLNIANSDTFESGTKVIIFIKNN